MIALSLVYKASIDSLKVSKQLKSSFYSLQTGTCMVKWYIKQDIGQYIRECLGTDNIGAIRKQL